jgi:hypothetical protein
MTPFECHDVSAPPETIGAQDTTTRVGPGRTVLEHQPGASPTDKDTTDS